MGKKRQKYCCFCGGAGLTKEHIWPDWAAPYLPKDMGHGYQMTQLDGWVDPVIVSHIARQGAPSGIQVRAVCASCNSGWMSGLEELVKPLLSPMMLKKPLPMALSRKNQEDLAKYFVMKTMVADFTSPRSLTYNSVERKKMFEFNEVSMPVSVVLFKYGYEPEEDVVQYNKNGLASYIVKIDGVEETMGIRNFTIRYRSLLVQVNVHRVKAMSQLNDMDAATFIHPIRQERAIWPPPRDLMQPEARWIQRMYDYVGPELRKRLGG